MTILSNNCSDNDSADGADSCDNPDSVQANARHSATVPLGRPLHKNPNQTAQRSSGAQLTRRAKKVRLDLLLVEQGLAPNQDQAKRLIMAGEVLINEEVRDKPGYLVPPDGTIRLRTTIPYVSRGGVKLAGALDAFQLDVTNLTAIDVGASTGGFTDCLLQRGVARVFAIDVGYGQLAWKVRNDPRVIAMERTNIRTVTALPQDVQADLAVIDASFISLALVLPATLPLLRPGGAVIALVKPQFEADKSDVGRGGVVRDERVHRAVLEENYQLANQLGLTIQGMTLSPLLGPAGNVEFLVWYRTVASSLVAALAPQQGQPVDTQGGGDPNHAIDISATIERLLAQALALRTTNS